MTLNYPKYSPVLTQLNPLPVGVRVSGVPNADVDLEITGDEIDTINITISAQQAQDGYCVPIKSNADGARRPFTISIVATGGISESSSFTAYVSEDIEASSTLWTSYLSQLDGYSTYVREFPTFQYSEIETIRQALKDQVYISGVPTGGPNTNTALDPISFPTQSVNGVTLGNANLASAKHLVFTMYDLDGYYFYNDVGWVVNTSGSNTLVIDNLGHGEAGHQAFYDAMLAAGYDYANVSLPALTNNPDVLAVGSWASRHDAIITAGVDRDGFDGRILFVFAMIRFLDWVLTQKAYTKIIYCGVSGGGHNAGLMGALYPNITKSFNCRGAFMRNAVGGATITEYEYAPNGYFDWFEEYLAGPRLAANVRAIDRLTQWMLCAHDGREYHHMCHFLDSGRYIPEIFTPVLEEFATSVGGEFHQITFTDPATATHGYQSDDINYILANI